MGLISSFQTLSFGLFLRIFLAGINSTIDSFKMFVKTLTDFSVFPPIRSLLFSVILNLVLSLYLSVSSLSHLTQIVDFGF